jgi:hypothetical protein
MKQMQRNFRPRKKIVVLSITYLSASIFDVSASTGTTFTTTTTR